MQSARAFHKRNETERQTRAKSRFGFSDSLSFWFLAVDVVPHFPREGKALGFFRIEAMQRKGGLIYANKFHKSFIVFVFFSVRYFLSFENWLFVRAIFRKMRMNLIKQIVLGDVFRRIIKILCLMSWLNAFEGIHVTI